MHRNNAIENPKEQLISLFADPEYNNLYRYDQETNSNNKITKIKEFAKRAKRAINKAQRIKILKVIKEIKTKLVVGIKTLLDIITITLQYRREDN